MNDLSVEFAGLKLKNPIIVGAGPNTKSYPTALNCMKAGFGGIVIRSLHLQHLTDEIKPIREFWRVTGTDKDLTKDFYSFQSTGAQAQRVKTDAAPGFGGAAKVPKLEEWAEIVQKITRSAKDYDCAVIASLGWCGSNISDPEVWKTEARAMTEAGVDALQLHTGPSPATEPGRYMMMDPEKYLSMPIRATREGSDLPIFPKIPVDCCDTISMAGVAQKAGAAGIVPVTRWISITMDIDNEHEPVWRGPGFGGPWSVPIMNGLIFRMRHHATHPISYIYSKDASAQFPNATPVTVPIIPSGGVRTGADIIGYMMAGANAAEICAQVILEGVGVYTRIEAEIDHWMEKKGYQAIEEFQGIVKLLEPEQVQNIPQWRPVVDAALCTACQDCIRACTNEAIRLVDDTAHIDDNLCEGCRSCFYICPTDAISLEE